MTRPASAPSAAPLGRRLLAEGVGTGLLVAVVVGSGAAATRLTPGDTGLQLFYNSPATVLGLATIILLVSPVSGAHLNPEVSAAAWWLGRAWAAPAVAAFIGAAYWFTSSTSFANPAVTVGRMLSAFFAGIAAGSVPGFVLAQLAGGAVGVALIRALYPDVAQAADAVVVPRHGTVTSVREGTP